MTNKKTNGVVEVVTMAYKKIYLMISIGALFFLIFLLSSCTAKGAMYGQYLDESYIIEDGYVTPSAKSDTGISVEIDEGVSARHGYIVWNISTLPPAANITDLSLVYRGLGGGGSGSPYIHGFQMDEYPPTSTPAEIHDDAYNGTHYIRQPPSSMNENNHNISYSLGDFLNTPLQDFEDNITRGWWGLVWRSADATGAFASAEHPTYDGMELYVEYELNAPFFNESLQTPLEGQTDVNLTPQFCINVSHDHGTLMNLTWYWYNNTNSSWEQFNHSTLLPNGTYCQWYLNATEPCTTYYWYVEAIDPYGNSTIETSWFTTHCVDPPTNVTCTRLNDTSINLTWTPDSNANGTSHTIVRYQDGLTPPGFAGGTFATNTTRDWVILNLTEGNCYGISLWTNWNWTNNWTLSDSSSNPSSGFCCTTGGNYTIAFRDEETEESLNFSRYPYNCSEFKLTIHYATIEDNEWVINPENIVILNGISSLNVTTTEEPLYFELTVFSDFNTTKQQLQDAGATGRSSYKRILRPETAQNISGRDTIIFYVANITVYNQYYSYWDGSYLNQTLDPDPETSVVKYNYNFVDQVGNFKDDIPQNVWVTFYTYNETGDKLIIHQEFWDSAKQINPALIYNKIYRVGINCSTLKLSYISIAPTGAVISNTIYIKTITELISLLEDITFSYGWQDGTGLWLQYTDPNYATDSIILTVDQFPDTQVATSTKTGFNSYNFSGGDFATLPQNVTYLLNLTFTRTVNDSTTTTSVTFILNPGISSPIMNATTMDILFVDQFGLPPFYNTDTGEYIPWSYMIFGIGACLIMLFVAMKSPALGAISGGITLTGASYLITGLPTIFVMGGVLIIILGFVMLMWGGRK